MCKQEVKVSSCHDLQSPISMHTIDIHISYSMHGLHKYREGCHIALRCEIELIRIILQCVLYSEHVTRLVTQKNRVSPICTRIF